MGFTKKKKMKRKTNEMVVSGDKMLVMDENFLP
jgi:hypothetical protein